ncbi:hypothetical protein L3Q67_01515 [Saccharothrix sp. AJ9571]|nr:hypothetical protein L3Q67_01515 [Saccharothrix sp. AJ9571]
MPSTSPSTAPGHGDRQAALDAHAAPPGTDVVARPPESTRNHQQEGDMSSTPETTDLVVVLKNFKRGGLREDGRHDFTPLLHALKRFPAAPAVIGMPECTRYDRWWGRPRRQLQRELNRLWPGSRYRGYIITERPGSRNWPGVFIDCSQITPIRWHRYGTLATRECLWGVLEGSFAGHHLLIKPLHFGTSKGFATLDREVRVLNELADGRKQVLALGDCNAITDQDTPPPNYVQRLKKAGLRHKILYKCAREPDGQLHLMTGPLSDLEDVAGWRNAGTQAENFTPTVNSRTDGGLGLRIDHILTSPGFTGDLVPDTYRVHIDDPEPDPAQDDHRMLSCTYRFVGGAPPPRPTLRTRIRQLLDPGAPPPSRGTAPSPDDHGHGRHPAPGTSAGRLLATHAPRVAERLRRHPWPAAGAAVLALILLIVRRRRT